MKITRLLTRNLQVVPDGTATRFEGRDRTWSEHVDRVALLAAGLRSLGVRDGDRVAILALNSDRYLEWFHATSWAGAVFVPINTRLATAEMVHWLTDCGATILFVDDRFLPEVAELRDQAPHIREICYVGDGPAPSGTVGFEELITGSTPLADRPAHGDDLAGIFYTGGTTGVSKGVMLSHRNVVTNALQIVAPCGYDADTVYLDAAPMFHLANGLGMFLATLVGATNVVVPTFDASQVLAAIERDRVTSTVMVPTMINMVANEPGAGERDLSSWRTLIYGGSPMTEQTIKDILAVAPGLGLVQTYGQTEASPVVTLLPPERHVFSGPLAGKTRSAGQAVYGVELAIKDPKGDEVPRGTVGEICARGETVMLGYYGREAETARSLQDGWLHTQDAGFLDEDGFLHVVDRLKDMIISGGENVYSAEVENALAKHPAVRECAVIGVPDERWGERVHAVVAVADRTATTAEDLIAHCRSLIAAYKCPRSVDVRHEELPKSGAGKILKSELSRPYWDGKDRISGA